MIELRPYQDAAVESIEYVHNGIIKAPAGSGKTIIAAEALRRWLQSQPRPSNVLWYANTVEQVEQGKQACWDLGITLSPRCNLEFACYAAGKACIGYDLVIFDEAHHIASFETRKCLDGYEGVRWGFSATPERGDDLKDDVFELIGPIVYTVERAELVETGKLAPAKVYFHAPNARDEFQPAIEEAAEAGAKKMEYSINHVAVQMQNKSVDQVVRGLGKETKQEAMLLAERYDYELEGTLKRLRYMAAARMNGDTDTIRKWLTAAARAELLSRARWHACQTQGIFENNARNHAIVDTAHEHINDSVLILVGSIEHGNLLQTAIPWSQVLHSKMGATKRREAMEAFRNGDLKCAIATSLADEGLDVPRANVLILASAGRSAAKAEQRTGRVLRAFGDKTHGTVHDFWDWQHPLLLNQSRARAKVYKGLDYEFDGGEAREDVLKAIGVTLYPAAGMVPQRKAKKNNLSGVGASRLGTSIPREAGGSNPRGITSADDVTVNGEPAAQSISNNLSQSGCINPKEVEDSGVAKTPLNTGCTTPPNTNMESANDINVAALFPAAAHADRAHARFSPSSLKSKAICPGFISDPSGDPSYANRGTLGHEATEKENPELCGDDAALKSAVIKSIGYTRKVTNGKESYRELKLPYLDQFGHIDCCAVAGNSADLIDYKFAFNFYQADSPQFWAYSLAIFDRFTQVDAVTVHVVHPFMDKIDVEKFTRVEHYELFAIRVKGIVAQAKLNRPEDYRITDQCRYCGFSGKCAKLASVGMEIGKRYAPEMSLPEGTLHGSEVTDPQTMAALQQLAPVVDKAAGGWRKAGLAMYDSGTDIPGYTLATKGGKRSVTSANTAYRIVRDNFAKDLKPEDFLEHCSVTATGLDDLVSATAAKGDKAKAVQRLGAFLEDEDALSMGASGRFLKKVK